MASYIDKRQSGRGRDGRSLSQATVTYASSITLTAAQLAAEEATIKISLTGALTIIAPTTVDSDQLLILELTCDTTSRQVTLSTGFQTATIIQLPLSETTILYYRFNGTAWVADRSIKHVISAVAYSATLAIAAASLNHEEVIYTTAALTGALTLNITAVTSSKIGDRLTVLLLSDGTGRVVTFGTNIATVGTLTLIASKRGSCSFVFDGTKYVETGRAIEA